MRHLTISKESFDTFLQTKYPRNIQDHLKKLYQDYLKIQYQNYLERKYQDDLEKMNQELLKEKKQDSFEKKKQKFFDKKFHEYLVNKDKEFDSSSNIEKSPYYIYKYLMDFTAKKLLSISLSEMDEVINEIQKIPGWSWLGVDNYNENIWKMCKSCKMNDKCRIGQSHIIHEDLKQYFGNKYKEWIGEKIEDEKKEEEDKEDKQEKEKVFTPYEFIKSLNIKACPYCNLEYAQTTTVNGRNKPLRPAFDHFYPKSKYPFFALSLNNLVPTCTTCNSSIKGDDDSIKSYKDIIHPYDEEKINYSDCIKYILMDVPQRSIEKLLDKYGEKLKDDLNELGISLAKDAKNILIEGAPPKDNLTEKEESEYIRAKRMFDYFAIKPRIEQGHSDYIREISIKAIEYPEDYINELEKKGYDFFDRLRLYFGNYINTEDFNLRPLSKITHDVIEHLRPDILNKLEKKKT